MKNLVITGPAIVLVFSLIVGVALIVGCNSLTKEVPTATPDPQIVAEHSAEQLVLKCLKAPSTAKFPDLTDKSQWTYNVFKAHGAMLNSPSYNATVIKSWVDAENGFGAELRSNFIVEFDDDVLQSISINDSYCYIKTQ